MTHITKIRIIASIVGVIVAISNVFVFGAIIGDCDRKIELQKMQAKRKLLDESKAEYRRGYRNGIHDGVVQTRINKDWCDPEEDFPYTFKKQ